MYRAHCHWQHCMLNKSQNCSTAQRTRTKATRLQLRLESISCLMSRFISRLSSSTFLVSSWSRLMTLALPWNCTSALLIVDLRVKDTNPPAASTAAAIIINGSGGHCILSRPLYICGSSQCLAARFWKFPGTFRPKS